MSRNRFLRTPSSGDEDIANVIIDKTEDRSVSGTKAQVAELVDALVSGTSGESRGGSSPLLGTSDQIRPSATS